MNQSVSKLPQFHVSFVYLSKCSLKTEKLSIIQFHRNQWKTAECVEFNFQLKALDQQKHINIVCM